MVVLPLNPDSHDSAIDMRLLVTVLPTDTTKREIWFFYQHNEHDEAIRFAYAVSQDWREIHKVTVTDAFGMLIAQFTAAWIYLGEDRFNDKRLGKRPAKPEVRELQPPSEGNR